MNYTELFLGISVITVIVINIAFWRFLAKNSNIRRKKLEEKLNPEMVDCTMEIAKKIETILKDIPMHEEIYRMEISFLKDESPIIEVMTGKAKFYFKGKEKDIAVYDYKRAALVISLFTVDIIVYFLLFVYFLT
jgi:hypothetical protein